MPHQCITIAGIAWACADQKFHVLFPDLFRLVDFFAVYKQPLQPTDPGSGFQSNQRSKGGLHLSAEPFYLLITAATAQTWPSTRQLNCSAQLGPGDRSGDALFLLPRVAAWLPSRRANSMAPSKTLPFLCGSTLYLSFARCCRAGQEREHSAQPATR